MVVRGKGGETRDEPDDDLRVRADCFNRRIWLDESASEVGRPQRILQRLPRWQVAGGVERAGPVRGDEGGSLQESAHCAGIPHQPGSSFCWKLNIGHPQRSGQLACWAARGRVHLLQPHAFDDGALPALSSEVNLSKVTLRGPSGHRVSKRMLTTTVDATTTTSQNLTKSGLSASIFLMTCPRRWPGS